MFQHISINLGTHFIIHNFIFTFIFLIQKCRNENWRSPDERKPVQTPQDGTTSSHDIVGPKSKPRKFGSMPRLGNVTVLQQTNGADQSSQGRSESKSEGHGNMYSPALEFNSNDTIPYHHPFENIQPITSHSTYHASSSLHRKQHSDEFFSFSNMECLIPNFSGSPQVYGTDNTDQYPEKPYYYNSFYPHQVSILLTISNFMIF